MVIFFNFFTHFKSSHPLQVENSRLVVDEDDNCKLRLERVNLCWVCSCSLKRTKIHLCQHPLTPANTRRWLNAGLMLGRRRRRLPNIKPALGQRLVFAGTEIKKCCSKCWFNAGLTSHTSTQHCTSVNSASSTHPVGVLVQRLTPPPPPPPPPGGGGLVQRLAVSSI